MGAWGTVIYSNDIAEDVRDACRDVFDYFDVNEGNKIIFKSFHEVLNQEFIDNEYASFWYALAAWQWKYGILNESVKAKALSLLKNYAGIEEWEEIGNKSDVRKRKAFLDRLAEQLEREQCAPKKPKLCLEKPKHKAGDIIVFKASDYSDDGESPWHLTSFGAPYMFFDEKLRNSPCDDVNGIDCRGKYMAFLCVGSIKEKHSEYIPDLSDEHSLYVWYDYSEEREPTVNELSFCGFLPLVELTLKDFSLNITESVSWLYTFTLPLESFKTDIYIDSIKKISGVVEESDRFRELFSLKDYSSDYWLGDTLSGMFSTMFEEKSRMNLNGSSIDDLLDPNCENSQLLLPAEVDKAYKEFVRGLVL